MIIILSVTYVKSPIISILSLPLLFTQIPPSLVLRLSSASSQHSSFSGSRGGELCALFDSILVRRSFARTLRRVHRKSIRRLVHRPEIICFKGYSILLSKCFRLQKHTQWKRGDLSKVLNDCPPPRQQRYPI
jgi:hypothetical protein